MRIRKSFISRGAAAALVVAACGATIGLCAERMARLAALPNIAHPRTGGETATTLFNGWQVTPAGRAIALMGDMPLGMRVTPDGKYLLVSTSGFHNESVNVISLDSEKLVQGVDVLSTVYGIAVSPSGDQVYLSGGNTLDSGFTAHHRSQASQIEALKQPVLRFGFSGGQLTPQTGADIPDVAGDQRSITGIETGPDGAVYVANYGNNTIYKFAGASLAVTGSCQVGKRPYALALSPDSRTLAVVNWAGDSVSLIDPSSMQERQRIALGRHPIALSWSKDGRLFVTNSGDNSVSVVRNGAVVETIKTSLNAQDPIGSTPDAAVVSPDGTRLYVANADNNDIAVIDISDASESRVLGFIPTGWYPTSLAMAPDGKRLFVGNGKGLTGSANAYAQTHVTSPETLSDYRYIPNGLSGSVSAVDIPGAGQLAAYTRRVVANTPAPDAGVDPAEKATAEAAFRRIKHIVYIIRENRTYDQVFGDITEGNGDPNLCLYGQAVTPNAHAMARQYVLLDNLYCNGEVSEDGHQWCDAAYATDWTERHWVRNYSSRVSWKPDDDMEISPAGYLWDDAVRHGLTYENYREYYQFQSSPNSPPEVAGTAPTAAHMNVDYDKIPWCSGARDIGRADIFIGDLRKAEAAGNWPNLMVLSLPEDHTQGLSPDMFAPTADVGENDQALGKIVDAVSHSKFWPETAIFIIEDDAQDGPDHVDSHRTVGLVISPYVKHGVVHTLYSTVSMVKTMEAILGLPPMTQYDKDATPMYDCFADQPVSEAYRLLAPQVDLEAKNPSRGAGEAASAKLDLTAPDRADPDKLNAILWAAARPGVPMPAPVRSGWQARNGTAIIAAAEHGKDRDD